MNKKSLLWVIPLLTLAVGMNSCNKEEVESYDSDYQVSFYAHDPGLKMKLGKWYEGKFHEYTSPSTPPYLLLVQWNDNKGKEAIDYLLEKNPDIISKLGHYETENVYWISSEKYFESPYFFVSSSYKSTEHETLDSYDMFVLPQIVLQMKDGKSVEAIKKEYGDRMTLDDNQALKGMYLFNCKLTTSRDVLKLASEIHQRDDVEWAEPNAYSNWSTFGIKAVGGEVYDGWTRPQTDRNDPLDTFFRDELHSPCWDDYGKEYKTFFGQLSWNKDTCLVINSTQEFQEAYMGTKELPEVDFENYTLIIGRTWGNDGSYELGDIILRDMASYYELETKMYHHVDKGFFCALIDAYYWRLYPKLKEQRIVLKRTVEDVKD